MKRQLFTLLAGACIVASSSAQALSLWGGSLDIDLQTGWRQDSLNFNTAAPDGAPDVAQERKWEGLRSIESFGRIEYEWCRILLRGYGNYGQIYSGDSSIKSWASNDREDLIDHRLAMADRGEVFDYGVALGYRLPWSICNQCFVFTPLVGWNQSEQHLRQFQGEDLFGSGLGPISEMHNNYQTRWYGPWLGYDLNYCLPCNLTLRHMFEWHWASFRAHGHDHEGVFGNPNAIRAKYSQHDHGQGYLVGGGADYGINRCWSVGITGFYRSMWCRNGKEKLEATSPVVDDSSSRLNAVNWHNWAVLAELDYLF